jgi:hypothetical protein
MRKTLALSPNGGDTTIKKPNEGDGGVRWSLFLAVVWSNENVFTFYLSLFFKKFRNLCTFITICEDNVATSCSTLTKFSRAINHITVELQTNGLLRPFSSHIKECWYFLSMTLMPKIELA